MNNTVLAVSNEICKTAKMCNRHKVHLSTVRKKLAENPRLADKYSGCPGSGQRSIHREWTDAEFLAWYRVACARPGRIL